MDQTPGRKKWSAPDGGAKPDTRKTGKANLAPRMGQKTKSPYQRYLGSQKKAYGNQTTSYNVGRTRRVG